MTSARRRRQRGRKFADAGASTSRSKRASNSRECDDSEQLKRASRSRVMVGKG